MARRYSANEFFRQIPDALLARHIQELVHFSLSVPLIPVEKQRVLMRALIQSASTAEFKRSEAQALRTSA